MPPSGGPGAPEELPYGDVEADGDDQPMALVAAPDSWAPLTKDFLVFEAKLLLDGLVDLVMAPLAAVAFAIDVVTGDRSGRRFQRLLRIGRRLENWVRLYRPSSRAGPTKDTLAAAGLTSADQLIAKIEVMLKEQELPETYRERLRELAEKARTRLPERPLRMREPGGPDRKPEVE